MTYNERLGASKDSDEEGQNSTTRPSSTHYMWPHTGGIKGMVGIRDSKAIRLLVREVEHKSILRDLEWEKLLNRNRDWKEVKGISKVRALWRNR